MPTAGSCLAAWPFCFFAFLGSGPLLLGLSFSFSGFLFCRVPFGVPVFACLLACWWWPASLLACLFSPFFSAGGFGRCVLFACRVGFGPRLFLALVSLCGSPSVPAGWRGGSLCSWCCLSGRFWVRARRSWSVLASLPLPSRPFSLPFVPVPPACFLAVGFLGSFIFLRSGPCVVALKDSLAAALDDRSVIAF